jgi:hypothetical protein
MRTPIQTGEMSGHAGNRQTEFLFLATTAPGGRPNPGGEFLQAAFIKSRVGYVLSLRRCRVALI